MRIFAKKAFEFKNSEGGSVTTSPLSFADIPDWSTEDNMFKWALEDGDIELIADKKDETDIEKGKRTQKPKEIKDAATAVQTDGQSEETKEQ
jgi:hypothetical protein